jgi:hypothetical protein
MDEDDFLPLSQNQVRNLFTRGASSQEQIPTLPAVTVTADGSDGVDDDVVPLQIPRTQRLDYSWGQVPGAALRNTPRSAGQFFGGIAEAIASPIDTAMSVFDLGAGALRSATPESVRSFIDQFDRDPTAAQRATETARAAGGFYADRYGSMAGFRRALAEDPVGVAADFSTLLSGGATATTRVAPTASSVLQRGANLTNPVMPLTQVIQGRIPGLGMTLPEAATSVVGTAQDILGGTAGRVQAANILRQSLGPEGTLQARQLALPQFEGLSAREAAVAANMFQPTFQAVGARVEGLNPEFYAGRARQAEAGRQGLLAAVSPDLEQSTAARAGASGPLYEAASSQPVLVTEGIRTTIEGLPANVIRTAKRLAKEDPNGPGDIDFNRMVIDGRSINYLRTAITEELGKPPSGRTAGTAERRFLSQRLDQLTSEFEAQVPEFRQARTTFAEMSAPVNQATVLNEMQRRLTGPLDAERPGQFMRVIGEGEEALIRRSTGAPRFQQGDLMRILTEEQGQAVTQVSDQLRRQADMTRQANEGAIAARGLLGEEQVGLPQRVPNVLNRTIMVINRTLDLLSGKVTDQTMSALDQAMRSGRDLNQVLNTLPAKDRSEVLRAINQSASELSPDKLRNIGLLQQVTEEDQPFRAELRGMAR